MTGALDYGRYGHGSHEGAAKAASTRLHELATDMLTQGMATLNLAERIAADGPQVDPHAANFDPEIALLRQRAAGWALVASGLLDLIGKVPK